MESELDVIDSLEPLGYGGPSLQSNVLTAALESGTRSAEFREVVTWLANELHVLRKTDEQVTAEAPSEFAMELSALLKELGCPFMHFVTGPLSDRFATKEARMQLLEYLITELMGTKMYLKLKPAAQAYVIPKHETNTARALENLTRDLCLGKPPENISPKALFDKINFKVEEQLRNTKPAVVSEPLFYPKQKLTDAQWKQLEKIHDELVAEYDLRRQMLLTRLEVTIQSFQWSDSMKKMENEILKRFQKKMQELEPLRHGGENTSIVELLAARSDLAIIEKTSSANVRQNTATKIQKHVIGSVPDRGGRAREHAPPPPEMPSWQQQRSGGPGRGGFGGGGGGGGNFRGGGRGGGGDRGGRGGGGFGGGGGGGGFGGGGSGNFGGGGSGGLGGGRGGGGNFRASGGSGGTWHQYSNESLVQSGNNQNWLTGSGRVQGSGWTQRGNNENGNSQHHGRGSGGGGGGNSNHRGRSNYNRGGGQRH